MLRYFWEKQVVIYRISLNSVPFLEKAYYIKKEHYSNFCTFEIASLVNVPGHYLRKYGTYAVWQYRL